MQMRRDNPIAPRQLAEGLNTTDHFSDLHFLSSECFCDEMIADYKAATLGAENFS